MAEEASAQFPVKTEEIRQNKKIPMNLPTNLPAKGQARPPSFAVGREPIEGWLTGRWRLFMFMMCSLMLREPIFTSSASRALQATGYIEGLDHRMVYARSGTDPHARRCRWLFDRAAGGGFGSVNKNSSA
jgi:hypothetical protein